MGNLAQHLERGGHSVSLFQFNRSTPLTRLEELKSTSVDVWITHCFYVFDIWQGGPTLENYFESSRIPVVTWFWENPLCSGSFEWLKRFQKKQLPKNILFLAVDTEHVELFRGQGATCKYLPMAVEDRLFDYRCPEIEKQKWAFDLAHIGTPCNQMRITIDDLSEMLDSYTNLFFLELINRMKTNFGETSVESDKVSVIIQKIGMPLRLFFSPMYTDPIKYLRAKLAFHQTAKMLLPDPWFFTLEEMSGRLDFVYSWYQLHYYVFNLVEDGIRVYGGEPWKNFLLPQYDFETPRLTEEELLACFSQTKIQFCVTKWQFRRGLHERPLKIFSVGGFPLTDFRPDLDELFEKDELITFEGLEDAREKIKFYLSNESDRQGIISRGRERTRRDHTVSARLNTMFKYIGDFVGSSKTI